MVHSIWYVEATCSGCKMREGNMFWSTPSNIIQHKILSVVWRCTEFPGIYAVLGLGKPRGLCVFIVHHSTLYSNHSKLYISRYIHNHPHLTSSRWTPHLWDLYHRSGYVRLIQLIHRLLFQFRLRRVSCSPRCAAHHQERHRFWLFGLWRSHGHSESDSSGWD